MTTMHKPLLSAALAALLLSGCTMIPDFERPALPVSAQWPAGSAYASQNGVDNPYVAAMAWKSFFQSPEMHYVIQSALDNNRDLRIAMLQVEKARALYRIERADLVPSLNGAGGLNRQGIPDAASPTGQDSISSTATANIGTAYEIDLFGRLRSESESALQKYFATAEAQKTARITLIAETANAYLAYLADKKLLTLTEETLTAQEQSFKIISQRHDLGVASQLDLEQARTSVEAARANKAMYTRRLAQDRNALELLMGTPPAQDILDALTLDSVTLANDLPVGLPSDVLLARPDIRGAEHNLLAADADIGAARAAFFPSISLTGSAGFASQSLSVLFSGGTSLAWSFIPQITLPLFSGGRNVANLDGAKASQKIAVAEYEKTIQTAFREVADQLAARGTYADQLQAQESLVAASRKTYEISRARYDQGTDSYLAVLDSQRALYGAEQSAIGVEQEYLSNLVNLYKALGGGSDS